jgi:hypothetical protein
VTRPALAAIALALATHAAPAEAVRLRARLARSPRAIQVRLPFFEVPARAEREVCQRVTLPNTRPVDVDRIDVRTPSGARHTSHHFAIFLHAGDPDAPPRSPVVDAPGCVGRDFGIEPLLAFVQTPRGSVRFPAGVGVRLEARQQVFLNSHFLNGSDASLSPEVAVNFRRARPGSIRHHARMFSLGTFRIRVPPRERASVQAAWTAAFPMNVVVLTTHSHRHTESVAVELLRGGASTGVVLETRSYTEPAVQLHATPLRLEPGDGFRWTCTYRNDGDREVRFGVTSEDEMCFTEGFFHLDDDAAPLPDAPGCLGQRNQALLCFR